MANGTPESRGEPSPSLGLTLYEEITEAPDEMARFRVIVHAIDTLERRTPRADAIASPANVRESELRLQKEIEQVRADLKRDIEQLRADHATEFERVRSELKSTELTLQKEITQCRGDYETKIEEVRREIKSSEVDLLKAMNRQTLWIIGAVGAIVGIVSVLDRLLG